MKGTQIIDKPIHMDCNQISTVTIPIGELPSGCYIVKVKQNNKSFIKTTVYPNPSTGRFNIKVDGDTIMHIVIYDSNGNLCYTDKYYNSDLVELNLSKFHKGVYVAVVESANKKYIQKLIIN